MALYFLNDSVLLSEVSAILMRLREYNYTLVLWLLIITTTYKNINSISVYLISDYRDRKRTRIA